MIILNKRKINNIENCIKYANPFVKKKENANTGNSWYWDKRLKKLQFWLKWSVKLFANGCYL